MKQSFWIDRTGIIVIGVVCLGYVLFGSTFAQLRLEFSFLNFPIFIGEILLAFCSLLFIVKCFRQEWGLGRWGWVLAAYLSFILLKTFLGYRDWGPLACRDAALFYYPLFIVLGYSFWSKGLFGHKARRLLFLIVLFILILDQFVWFWPCSLVIIGAVLALKAKSLLEQSILIVLIFVFAPYLALGDVFLRTAFLSTLITLIFIISIFLFLFCKDHRVRIVCVLIGAIIFGIAIYKASQTEMGKTFFVKDAKILATTMPSEPSPGKCLFHPVGGSSDKPDEFKQFISRMRNGLFLRKISNNENRPIVVEKSASAAIENESSSAVNKYNYTVQVKKDDTRFRYYIWRDMAVEYLQYKPLFGFSFGRPLCSASIYKYFKEGSTQSIDGWVGAHNSFFYIIYRAGILGVVMVCSLLFIWFDLVRDFYFLKDWAGLLLCAIILNWFVSANFFLIFELPYTAIPLWTIMGIALKHRMLLKK